MREPTCTATTEPALPPLSDSARVALLYLARQLSDGFTGEILLRCHGGGVRHVVPSPVLKPEDLDPAA